MGLLSVGKKSNNIPRIIEIPYIDRMEEIQNRLDTLSSISILAGYKFKENTYEFGGSTVTALMFVMGEEGSIKAWVFEVTYTKKAATSIEIYLHDESKLKPERLVMHIKGYDELIDAFDKIMKFL